MNGDAKKPNVIPVNPEPSTATKPKGPNRRQLLGGVSSLAAAAATVGAIGLEPLVGGTESAAEASIVCYPADKRSEESFRYRTETARAERISVREQPDNGDSKRLRISAAISARLWLTTALVCPTWLPTRAYCLR
jgi:hypothetical protein